MLAKCYIIYTNRVLILTYQQHNQWLIVLNIKNFNKLHKKEEPLVLT